MLDITFITTNNTKLSHAKYLSAGYEVNILHYRRKHYGVGYTEPRIKNKKQLLEESMNDAIERWKKYVSHNNNTQLFFIEDTSVRIDVLSDEENDYPGADIKFWMQETDFNNLDNQLKIRGNNRKASVTSHIVLFLTDEIKKRGKINKDYEIFTSTSYGNIVDKEYSFETNILYPWLDNKTFNKWFVPNDYDIPISMLDIKDADKGDFRKGAFEQMFNFLGRFHDLTIKNKFINLDVFLSFFPIYIISGPTCAGKSTIGKHLLEILSYYHIEASDFMTLKYLETHGTNFTVDKHNFAAEILKVNPVIVVEDLLKYIKQKNILNKIIITGFRTSNEIYYFCKMFASQEIKTIYINADFEIRYNRWKDRKRENTQYTLERFREINSTQDEMGLFKIKEMNNAITFDNNKDGLEILFNSFNELFINADLLVEKNINLDIINPKKIPLEKAILLALAIEYKNNYFNFFTTTEISRLINNVFTSLNKNKNNVSRYFNQSFYPYYEIKKENGKLKYRLSPTGYSEACFIIRNIQEEAKCNTRQ